jgi:low affinity Fe/Cu permease
MEWWPIGFCMVMMFVMLNTERQMGRIRRDTMRVDRKLNLILDRLDINFDESIALSDRVKELARDPSRRIEAIKVYRQETGAELVAAKAAIETFINSIQPR